MSARVVIGESNNFTSGLKILDRDKGGEQSGLVTHAVFDRFVISCINPLSPESDQH